MASSSNLLAASFKRLHRPGKPLVLTNVYDMLSASTVAALPRCNALATSSYAIARASGMDDDDMDLETNLNAVRGIATVAAVFKMPLTVDIQDAYGKRLEESITKLIELGVVGINLEDYDKEAKLMYSLAEAADRIRRTLHVANKLGLKDFVVNARCDTLVHGGRFDEVITRGRAYLAAGATTVFVWGGRNRGVTRQEVITAVKHFDGRVNVSMKFSPDGLDVHELSEIGVARISTGSAIQSIAVHVLGREAEKILAGSQK